MRVLLTLLCLLGVARADFEAEAWSLTPEADRALGNAQYCFRTIPGTLSVLRSIGPYGTRLFGSAEGFEHCGSFEHPFWKLGAPCNEVLSSCSGAKRLDRLLGTGRETSLGVQRAAGEDASFRFLDDLPMAGTVLPSGLEVSVSAEPKPDGWVILRGHIDSYELVEWKGRPATFHRFDEMTHRVKPGESVRILVTPGQAARQVAQSHAWPDARYLSPVRSGTRRAIVLKYVSSRPRGDRAVAPCWPSILPEDP